MSFSIRISYYEHSFFHYEISITDQTGWAEKD